MTRPYSFGSIFGTLLPIIIAGGCFDPEDPSSSGSLGSTSTGPGGGTNPGETTSTSINSSGDPADSTTALDSSGSSSDSTGAASCGNGVIEDPEECDLGVGNTDNGACTSQCRLATCGDGLVHLDREECDSMGESADCDADCTLATCGDGVVNATANEACDDTNTADADGCSSRCALESGFDCRGEPSVCMPVCGDGLIVSTEACDDMNLIAGDGCSDVCEVEPGYQCFEEPSECCTPDTLSDLQLVEVRIGSFDSITIQNTGGCEIQLDGIRILFDDSLAVSLDYALPPMALAGGQTLSFGEADSGADVLIMDSITFSSTRGGAALLCNGPCDAAANVLDVFAFSEGQPHPPLPAGVTFLPAGLNGIADENLQFYARIDFMGVSPNFLAGDWMIQ
ncbi:MAG: DUF4215 domain-containing protein [Myxococcota bacterium]